jgi:hypothetical protein
MYAELTVVELSKRYDQLNQMFNTHQSKQQFNNIMYCHLGEGAMQCILHHVDTHASESTENGLQT